ncbi:DUF5132 domain-containing protein [Vacuolonema iberomarrocanum]|uniref:DUF5132 domain-containing protein n=1 Tax=Vacuolonema iberomarrocanum TaxID=3454632 RepID=UPI0019F8A01F|nr:DUF5132 domain-containing protein [filamentous cyanobacterium LEGE 07170]
MLNGNQTPVGLRTRVAELASNPNAKALVIGVTAVAVTPIVLPMVKPALKATIKSGVTLYEKAKIAIAETGEALADIAAEARAEVQADTATQSSLHATTPAPSPTSVE